MESENNQQHKKDQESSLQEQESGVQDCSADVVQDINQISSEIEFIQTECDSESLETTVLLTDTSGKEAVQNNQNLLTERNSKESPQLKDVIEVEDTAFDTEEPEIIEIVDDKDNENSSAVEVAITEVEISQPPQDSQPVLKSKIGPPPGLLPLEKNSSVFEKGLESRTPRLAALRSAEKIKVMARVELPSTQTSSKKEIVVLRGSKGNTYNGAASVQVFKTLDPNFELCRGCNKMEPCEFQTTGRKGKDELSFCSKRCVQGFFKFGGVHFVGSRNIEEAKSKEMSLPSLQDSFQDQIIIEPDIEIQTLSDEFQIESEELELSSAFKGDTNVAFTTLVEQIEKAAQETLSCSSCSVSLYHRTDPILWESMEFCSDNCLKTYVKVIGSHCNMCNSQVAEQNLGKLCVRFGTIIRQFCTADCLEKFKSRHKLCAQCQINMPDKDKVYCSSSCEELSRRLKNKTEYFGKRICAVCTEFKPIHEEVYLAGKSNWLCSKPCRNAFRFANKVTTLACGTCSRCYDVNVTPRYVTRITDKGSLAQKTTLTWYCSNVCFATHLLKRRKIETCGRCHVKKYNVDMIRKLIGDVNTKEEEVFYFCSVYCYTHHSAPPLRDVTRKKMIEAPPPASSFSSNVDSSTTPLKPVSQTLTTNPINVSLQSNSIKIPVPAPPATVNPAVTTQITSTTNSTTTLTHSTSNGHPLASSSSLLPLEVNHKIVFVPPKPKEMRNKAVWCRPSLINSQNDDINQPDNKALQTDVACQSDEPDQSNLLQPIDEEKKPLYIPIPIPIPVPIYVPIPMAMYNFPAPFPVAFPVPMVTPFLFPVDKDLMTVMLKTIKESSKTSVKAALSEETSSVVKEISTVGTDQKISTKKEDFTSTPSVKSNIVLVEYDTDSSSNTSEEETNIELELPCSTIPFKNNSRKRSHSASNSSLPSTKRLKDSDSVSSSDGEESTKTSRSESPSLLIGSFQKEIGVKAWMSWMKRKEEKQPTKAKLNEMNVQDLNSSLIAFVNEIRKPNGDAYRSDVLLYLTYGLQQSFGVDRRRQNLLMDVSLLPFQLELDKHLQPFYDALLKGIQTNSTAELVTSLKESHLWECQQLGVDSPIVLVFTMLYFNTKYFRLYTAEQHEQMTFTNVHKIQKKTVHSSMSTTIANGSACKNVAKIFSLQFLPSAQQQQGTKLPNWFRSLLMAMNSTVNSDAKATSNLKPKKPFEMPQNVDRPSQCPIKHYNFYLSKCPESVKIRQDMFYLLPETSSTPESLVWYSTQPVPREILARMLRRVLLIEEVLNNLCSSD